MSSREQAFRDALVEALRRNSTDLNVEVEPHKSLWCRVQVSDNGRVEPPGDKPRRGFDTFEQDIVIFEVKDEREVPRVAIEAKFGGCSRHEVIVSSTKARLMKQVYPFLRYILALGGVHRVTPKLIKHGEFLDGIMVLQFYYSRRSIDEADWRSFVAFIRKEVDASRRIGQAREGTLNVKAILNSTTIIEG